MNDMLGNAQIYLLVYARVIYTQVYIKLYIIKL